MTFPTVGQEIDKVIFTSKQADEPPTKQGRPKYSIEFKRLASDELSTSDFYYDKRKKRLNDKVTIDKDRAEKVTEWKKQNKRTFTQSDLGLDITTLKTQTNNHKLNFDLPTDLVVSVDSFQFCQTYKMTKSISTGGETLTVTLIYNDGQKEEFILIQTTLEKEALISEITSFVTLYLRTKFQVKFQAMTSFQKVNSRT